MSHEAAPLYDRASMDAGVRVVLDVVQRVTGYAPPTCPWRCMYSPLVREVLAALDHEEHGNLAVALGADPPAILIDAIGQYRQSYAMVLAENQKLAMEKAKRERAVSR